MTIQQLVVFGDSLTEGDENTVNAAISEGGSGGWVELMAELLGATNGIGPLVSSGARFMNISALNEGAPEWTYGGGAAWTAVAGTDLFDKLPYGDGKYSSTGTTATATWTKPLRWRRTLHGVAVYFVDYASGDLWSYSTDGGTTWTDITVSLSKDNKLAKFYVTGNIAQFTFRAANAAGTAKGCFPAAIEAFYLAPSTTAGLIVHNCGRNGLLLRDLVGGVGNTTVGDRMAFVDSVHILDGTAISNQPNAGTLMMHGRDVTLASTSQWNTDLGTFWARIHTLGTPLWMNHFELSQFPDETNSVTPGFPWATQTSYRDQLKTTAASESPVVTVLDQYDRYQKMGYGVVSGTTVTLANSQNVALRTAGFVNSADNGHQLPAGHRDQLTPIYWFVRNNLFASSAKAPVAYPTAATMATVAYTGKQTAPAYSACSPLAPVPV